MEPLYCLLSPAPPYIIKSTSFKVSSSAATRISLLSRASVASPPAPPLPPPQHKTSTPKKRSSKPTTKTTSPATPTTASTTLETSPIPDPVPPKKVLVPIGFGTEEMEAVIMVDVLRRAGAEVTVASVEPQLEIVAASGTRLVADTSISTCSKEIFDLVALPGGMPGSARLRDCKVLQQITTKQAEDKRLFGAIFAAPAITLLPWGLLRKKQHVMKDDVSPGIHGQTSNLLGC